MKVPEHIISQLNAQADLVAIIRRHTTLKPAGREFKGNCPFHGEKTPSFYVNPATNLYYCFGCGAKGNAISFLVDFEKLTFVEALKTLSAQTGIDLPKEDVRTSYQRNHSSNKSSDTPPSAPKQSAPFIEDWSINSFSEQDLQSFDTPHDLPSFAPTPAPKQTDSEDFVDSPAYYEDLKFDEALGEHGDLYALLNAICRFYQSELLRHSIAYDYFLQRGLTKQSIENFELGYAPDGWQHLQQVFKNDIEGLKLLGLIRTSKHGRDFCLLRDRVIFPIKNGQGQVVGFAGRALDDAVMPKYINSSDSVVFNKQHILYGLYQARQAHAKQYLLVEGYMDVISLHQAGIFGAVAPMGTAANQSQIASLLKYNNTLTLSFDGDAAGQKAALRTLQVAMPVLEDGKTLKFLSLPDNHDPDTFIKSHGKDAMLAAIDSAMSLSDYLYTTLSQKFDLTKPESKAAAMAEFRQIVNKLPKYSSLRIWLNKDFYARLNQKHTPKRVNTANYDVTVTTAMQELFLCILYKPTLIQTNFLHALFMDTALHQITAIVTLQDISGALAELIDTARTLLPYLPYHHADHHHLDEIDANAHFILSAISQKTLKNTLTTRWRAFFSHTKIYDAAQLQLKFDELMCQILIEFYKQKQSKSQNLRESQLFKRCAFILENHLRQVIKPKIQEQHPMIL